MHLRSLFHSGLQATLIVLGLTILAGCSSVDRPRNANVGEVHLFGLPTALTLPGSSLPAGIGVRVYVSELGKARGLPLQRGQLDILMFDQPASGLNPQTAKPLKVWTFQPSELGQFRSDTLLGTGYQFELKWDQNRPKGRVITVAARYRGPSKTELYSPTTVIAVSTQ